MQKITPFLWSDGQAEEAANFYVSAFKNSKIDSISKYTEEGSEASGVPAGKVMVASFTIEGLNMQIINGGPIFKPTPSVSFFVNCSTVEEIDELWSKFSNGAEVLMEFQKYPFSEKYGWLNDKFGVSWQFFIGTVPQKITPFLMFTGSNAGKAEEAMKFYTSIFKDSKIIMTDRYREGLGEPTTSVVHGEFKIGEQLFMAMDSSGPHKFNFTEGNSLMINVKTQEEIDYFWEKLTDGGSPSQCGWLKDKYGLSWQVTPEILGKYMSDPDKEKAGRAMAAMLKMTKINISEIEKAYQG